VFILVSYLCFYLLTNSSGRPGKRRRPTQPPYCKNVHLVLSGSSEKFPDRAGGCDNRPGCHCHQKREKQCFDGEFKMILLGEKVLGELQESAFSRKFCGSTCSDCPFDLNGVHARA